MCSEESGDDYEVSIHVSSPDEYITMKQLAAVRFHRNHRLMAEIFNDVVVPDMRTGQHLVFWSHLLHPKLTRYITDPSCTPFCSFLSFSTHPPPTHITTCSCDKEPLGSSQETGPVPAGAPGETSIVHLFWMLPVQSWLLPTIVRNIPGIGALLLFTYLHTHTPTLRKSLRRSWSWLMHVLKQRRKGFVKTLKNSGES